MSKPTARELLDRAAKNGPRSQAWTALGGCDDYKCECHDLLITLAERVEKVLALHNRKEDQVGVWCEACCEDWPCPTVRRLNGEKP